MDSHRMCSFFNLVSFNLVVLRFILICTLSAIIGFWWEWYSIVQICARVCFSIPILVGIWVAAIWGLFQIEFP